jgi:hypothetical protein
MWYRGQYRNLPTMVFATTMVGLVIVNDVRYEYSV